MNTEEAKEKLRELAFKDLNTKPDKLRLQDVYAILDKLDRPKVVIPNFVAEWIEKHKKERWWLGSALSDRENKKFREWLVICDMDTRITNQDVFARAWLDGYEVEQEKLYTVEIPNPENRVMDRHMMLVKSSDGRITLAELIDSHVHLREDIKLTESEICKDFEWAWQFAKEVRE